MKTKAYKLAAELGLQEQSLLEWLRDHGYPNARRADTIRSEVCQQARKALGRGGHRDRGGRRGPQKFGGSKPQAAIGPERGPRPGPHAAKSLSVSFGELLGAHLPADTFTGDSSEPAKAQRGSEGAVSKIAVPGESGRETPTSTTELDLDAERRAFDRERDVLRTEIEGWRVRAERIDRELVETRARLSGAESAARAVIELRGERERLLLECTTLRRRVSAVEDERDTIEHTALEFQLNLAEARQTLTEHEQVVGEQRSLETELAQAHQREMAWRARALELERAVHLGENLATVLERAGVEGLESQMRALRALLSTREGAFALFRAVKNVDAESIAKLVHNRMSRVCADRVCNQCVEPDLKFVLRVDDEADCEICRGSADRRWFQRMVRECDRAGVRRLLVIGGRDETRNQLRGLSEGQPVDLRLVSDREPVEPGRARGRVECCDLLVLWRDADEDVVRHYRDVAKAEGQAIVTVLGPRTGVAPLARSICNRLARNLAFTAA